MAEVMHTDVAFALILPLGASRVQEDVSTVQKHQ